MTKKNIEQKRLYLDEVRSIIDLGKQENRKLTEQEDSRIKELRALIAEVEATSTELPPTNERTMPKELRIVDFISAHLEGRSFTDEQAALLEIGKRGMQGLNVDGFALPLMERDIAATLVAKDSPLVGVEKMPIVQQLTDNLILVNAGARFITGIQGNVSFPTAAAISATWKDENAAADDAQPGIGEKQFSPKRLTVNVPISKRLLLQSGYDVEMLVREMIINAFARKIEGTVLSSVAASDSNPAGILPAYTNSSLPAIKGAASWANICTLESTVNPLKGGSKFAYLTNAKGRSILKTTTKTQDSFLSDGKELNGYTLCASNLITPYELGATAGADTQQPLVFGRFDDLYIIQFGNGIDIVVDPYSAKKNGKIEICASMYVDAGLVSSDAISVGTIK